MIEDDLEAPLTDPIRHRLLNGDPHPGNSPFLPDGRVAFIDFGFFKTLSQTEVEQLIASTRATYENDAEALFEVISGLGALPPDSGLAEPCSQQNQRRHTRRDRPPPPRMDHVRLRTQAPDWAPIRSPRSSYR